MSDFDPYAPYDPSQFTPQSVWNPKTGRWEDKNLPTRKINNREKIEKALDALKGHGYGLQDIKLPAYPAAQGAGPEKFASAQDHARAQEIDELMQGIRQTAGGEPPEITALRFKKLNDALRRGELPVQIALKVAHFEQRIRMEGKRSASKYEQQMRNLDQMSTEEKWRMNPQAIDQTREEKLKAIETAQPAVDALFAETAKNFSRILGRDVAPAELRNIVKGLSDEQLAAATSNMQAVLLTAGPGSGKSGTLQTMAMREIANAQTPQQALEAAKKVTVLSQTHSAVNNFMDKLEKIRQLVPGWTEEQLRTQGRTLASWGMSMLTRGQTMGTAENPVSILQTIAQKTGMTNLAPLYQGSKGDTFDAEVEKRKQQDMLRRVFERHQIKGQGANLSHYAQKIEEIKGGGRETLHASMQTGKKLYEAKAHEMGGKMIPDDLALYLYQQALRNQRGFDIGLGGARFDINDVPHMLLYAANAGMFKAPSGTYIVDESQDTPPIYGELFSAMGKMNQGTRFFMGGDPSQMAIDRSWDFGRRAQTAFGETRSSFHPLTVNFRSDAYTVGFLNAINALAMMAGQPQSPMQISYAGGGTAPAIRTEQNQPTLYHAMFNDWLEHMQTSLPQLKEGMEMGDPFGATRYLPGEAPFQFMQGPNERDIFYDMLPSILSQEMPPAMVKEFMEKHVTRDTPSPESIMKLHAITMSQARGREFPAVFSDLTYGGAWNQIGLNKQMFTMGSRVKAGGQNFFYGSLTNVGKTRHDLTPDYFAGQRVMGGFGTLLQGMTEDASRRQGVSQEDMEPAYQMALQSNTRIMYPEGAQAAAERRGPTADSAIIQEYISRVRELAGYHSPAVGMGSSGIQQGDPLQYSEDDPAQKSPVRTRGMMNAAVVAGQSRRGGQSQMLIEYASRLADALVRQGPGASKGGFRFVYGKNANAFEDVLSHPEIASVPTPQKFLAQAKSATEMIPYKLLEEIEREAPSEFAEFDNRPDNFIKRDWHEGYLGRDDKLLRRATRIALDFPGFAQSPEIMTRTAQFYTHPQVLKTVAGLANAKDSRLVNLQQMVKKAWMPEGLVHRKKQRIDELLTIQEQEGKMPKALQGLNIGKGADVSRKNAMLGGGLTKKEQEELASLQEEMKHVGPEAQNRIIAALTTPVPVDKKHDPKLFNRGIMQAIHQKAVSLLAESRLDPDFLDELAGRASQVLGTIKDPKQKALIQSIADTFKNEADQMREDGVPLTHKMLSQIRRSDPAQAALLARIFTDKETGDFLPYDHPDVKKAVAQISYHRGVVERGQAKAIGMPIAHSRTAPARTQLRSLYLALQGGFWEGGGSGAIDPQAVQAIARPGMDPEKPIDDHFDFPEYGVGAPLHAQRQRYMDMLSRGGMTKIKREELEHRLAQVQQVESGFGSEENQRNWAHTIQMIMLASSRESVIDLRKGEDYDRDPVRGWFEHRENMIDDHRSLERLIDFMEALQQATTHIQQTGTINRGHLDDVLKTFGFSPDDKRMTGLRKLEEKEHFTAGANLPLQRLIAQFPDDTKEMQERLTRAPMIPDQPYQFRGGEEGFGGLALAQQELGIPIGAGIEGTLHPFAEGDPFGVAKFGIIHKQQKMLSGPDYKTFISQSEEEKGRNFMPLFQFQGTHQGQSISFPVNPEQLSLVPASEQEGEESFLQWQEDTRWQRVRAQEREKNAYTPEEILSLTSRRPRYALDPSPELGQHGYYSFDQMRALEPTPGNPLWIGQGGGDMASGYDYSQSEYSPIRHGEAWGSQHVAGLIPQPAQESAPTSRGFIPEHGPRMTLDTDFLDSLMKDAPTLERGAEQSLLLPSQETLTHPRALPAIPKKTQPLPMIDEATHFDPQDPSFQTTPMQAVTPAEPLPPHADPTHPDFQTWSMKAINFSGGETIPDMPAAHPQAIPAVEPLKKKPVRGKRQKVAHPQSLPAIQPRPPRTAQAAYDIVRERSAGYRVPDRPSGPRGSDLNYALWVHQKTQAFLPTHSSYITNPTKGRGRLLLPQVAASRVGALRPRAYHSPRPRRQINRGRVADVIPLGPEHHPPLQIGGPGSHLLLPERTGHPRRIAAQARLNAAREGLPSSSSPIEMRLSPPRLQDVPRLLRQGGLTISGVPLRHLSKEQRDVLESQAKHQVIQGGPGTGKTDVAVMRQLDQIAQGKLDPSGIRAFSGLHSGVDEINKRYDEFLRPLLPQAMAKQLPPAGTVHSFAHQIVFPHGEPSPLLEQVGWGHFKNLVANPDEHELATMTPEEAGLKRGQQTKLLRSALQTAYPAGTKMPLSNRGLEKALKDINEWKLDRVGENSAYDRNMALGLEHLSQGKFSHQGALAAYEYGLRGQQAGDYGDLITASRQMLEASPAEAVPPELANTQMIFYDEQQDAPPEQMAMFHAFQKATGAQMLVGLDPMQALFQEHADQNIPSLLQSLGDEGAAHHELTVNYRGDRSNVALYNAVLGQSENPLSRPQVVASPLQGRLPKFILKKSEPALYKETFASMLGDTGVPFSAIKENIIGERHPFHGVDWEKGRGEMGQALTKPGQIPIQFATKAQRRLFEHVAPEVLQRLDPEKIDPKMARRAFGQMYRSGVPGKKAYEADKAAFARGEKFSGIMVGQGRSRAYDKPYSVVHRSGHWAQNTPAARESYLNNLGVQVSRVRAGGQQTLVAASRPFNARQADEYINSDGASFSETEPSSLFQGTVSLGDKLITGNPNTTHFQMWGNQPVPHGFPAIMEATTSQIADWKAQLSSPMLPPPAPTPVPASMPDAEAVADSAQPLSSLHVFEGNVPPSRMARGMYPQGHHGVSWAAAQQARNQAQMRQVPPPLSRKESQLALPPPRSQTQAGPEPAPQADTRVPLQGEALPPGVGFQKINIPPGGNIKIEGTDIKIDAKGTSMNFGAASPGPSAGKENTFGGFRFAGTGGALGRSVAGGLGTSGNPDITIDARGGGGGRPPSGPPTGTNKDYATPFFNGMQQTGRTLARISSEMQFFGKLFTDITNSAAGQGSAYRMATTGMPGSGATADQGFFNFSDRSSGISQMSANLPMYSTVQNAQMLRNIASQTGGFGINVGTATTYQQLGAVTGMDPTHLMQQGAYYTGTTGQGMSTAGTNNLVASMEGLYGGNLTAMNVGPTMQAINSVMPSMQGNALGQGNQLQPLMTLFGAAMKGGATAQNLPDIAGTIGNLTQIGMNPDLRQQYVMNQLFPGQLTGGVQLAQFNQQQLGQQEQIAQLSLQKAVDLPGLQIKINNADIALQSANFDLAQMQQQYNQASYANAQLNQQYAEASFQEKQYVQTQEYGPIGADTGRNSYFDFMRNQMAAGYNPLSAETGTQFKPSAPQGIQNMQFYAGVEHQRQDLILSRSPLLSDAKFQEDMKYLNQQEAFYKQQLDLTNQQRKFEVDWTTKLLASQGHLLNMQGPMLDQQKKILGIQGQQLDLNKAMTDYQNKSLLIQQEYLPKQLDALQAIQKATSEFMGGEGPLNGKNASPEDIIKQLAGVKDDKQMRQEVQAMGLSPSDTNNVIQMVEGIKKAGGWDSVAKGTSPQDKALQGQIDAFKKSGAFTDQKSQSAVQNAYLQFAGTGGTWDAFQKSFDTANTYWQSIAESFSIIAPIMKNLATFLTIAGPLVMGAALSMNTTGTAGSLVSKANNVIPGGAGGAAFNPVTLAAMAIAGEATLDSMIPATKPGAGIGNGPGQNSIWSILGHGALAGTPGGMAMEGWNNVSQSAPGLWNGMTGWLGGLFNGGPNKAQGGTATQGGANARSGGLDLPSQHPSQKGNAHPGTKEQADLGPLMIKSIGASWDAFWKGTAGKALSGFFGTIHDFFFKTVPDWLKGIADYLKNNLSGFAQWLRLEFDTHIVTPFQNAINGFVTFKDKTLPDMFHKALELFDPGNKNNLGHMIADVFSKIDWGKIFGQIKWPWSGGAGGSGGGSEPAGHPGFTAPSVNTDFGQKVWYGSGKHQGVDFRAAQGTQLREFVGGEVINTGWYDWGGEVDVRIPGGLTERYLHLSSIGVKKGDVVGRGKYLGLTGGGTKQSGLGYWSTGPHSHVQYDTGNYTSGVNPWQVWRKFSDMNLANFYGSVGKPEGAQGGAGGGAGIPIPHLATGGIAMHPMMASIAEREPEAVVPLSKLSETLKSLNHSQQGQTITQTNVSQQTSGGSKIEVKSLIGNATFNISANGNTISDHDKDVLMSEIFEVFAEAIKQLNGKL